MTYSNHPNITEQEVRNVARLARLRVDEKNLATYSKSLSDILDLITEISTQNTDAVLPMSSPIPNATLTLRDDTVTEHVNRELYQRSAQSVESGLYLVPKVIE